MPCQCSVQGHTACCLDVHTPAPSCALCFHVCVCVCVISARALTAARSGTQQQAQDHPHSLAAARSAPVGRCGCRCSSQHQGWRSSIAEPWWAGGGCGLLRQSAGRRGRDRQARPRSLASRPTCCRPCTGRASTSRRRRGPGGQDAGRRGIAGGHPGADSPLIASMGGHDDGLPGTADPGGGETGRSRPQPLGGRCRRRWPRLQRARAGRPDHAQQRRRRLSQLSRRSRM